MIPSGYKAVLVGSVASLEDLVSLRPVEEASAEGSLMLLQIDLGQAVSSSILQQIDQKCQAAGVEPWPWTVTYAWAEPGSTTMYVAWQKGVAWLPVIGGILGSVLLLPVLGIFLWWLMPESLKSTISDMVSTTIMMVMILFMGKLMQGVVSEGEKK
ncbi:MAG: hypothetical protein DRI39_08800 [Chloroflexi bacterium]|nr:MAG: hypothetical protein DRI39_08800 [Chloroflexota bacterium]